jgi:peptidyl-prolyl cis-trans isomerase B (cyclophilin B)
VKNFLTHCKKKFYKKTYFHRVIPGFMIQGGDPNTLDKDRGNDGQGGHSYKGKGKYLDAEFNDVKHVRGILSMARSQSPDSAGSQFFILVADNPALDGQYTAFGEVLYGMDAVDEIVKQPGVTSPGPGGTNPTEHQYIEEMTLVEWTPEQIKDVAQFAEKRMVEEALDAPRGKQHVAILETTQGKIYIKFFTDKAPMHVYNFMHHCKSGFYKGTYFHRVFPGFMVQGGDPNTKDDDPANDGQGGHSFRGKDTLLKAEFNDTKHVRGILSMARTQSPDSAGSQFFIMVAENTGLDGKYSAFGKVIYGMKVVDAIVGQPGTPIPGAGGVNPTEHQVIEKVSIELWKSSKVRKYERKRER